jgi:hypothetical protein
MSTGLKANSDGSAAIQVGGSDAITISTALDTTFAGTAAVPTGTLYPIVSGTAVASTSGTSIDFTSIPSWVKRITVMFRNFSTNGTSNPIIQVGSGSILTSGYSGATLYTIHTGSNQITNYSTGFAINSTGQAAASVYHGSATLSLQSANVWVFSFVMGYSNTTVVVTGGGSVSLSGILDRLRITTVNGTDTFDAGSINILYE